MSCEHQGPKTATACDPCSPGLRNRYFRGKLLTVADYRSEQAYLNGRRRLITRQLLGWGIASGFEVERNGAVLTIGAGVAFDCHGRELVACERVEIDELEDVLWLEAGDCGLQPGAKPAPGRYLLAAHYAECRIDGVRVEEGCGEAVCEANHVCETVVYSLRRAESPWCPPVVQGCDGLDPDSGFASAPQPGEPVKIADSGDVGAIGLCRQSRCGICGGGFDPCRPGKLSRHGALDVDFEAGVPLAYVLYAADACDVPTLTDLIHIVRACEPTRIKDIGWRKWHEHPELVTGRKNFRAMFVEPPKPAAGPDPDSGDEDDEDGTPAQPAPANPYPPVDTRFWVCFSAPVQIASLTRDVITMTLIQADGREAVGNMVRVPINDLWVAPTSDGDPPGTTRGFRPKVRYQFWQGEIVPGASSGFSRKTLVEVRIHGDLIIDWAGQPVDGNAIGRRLPSGNGTPGGKFLSSWRVIPKNADVPPR
ncbi:MAG: hypothetical protein JWO81_2752 [Alphaproteobacteria bacterium]|nr:hypothetical protein [Alphaproteobacteria bacterium]